MREKSFIEILSDRIKKDLKKELFPSENDVFPSENLSQNTKKGTFSYEKTPNPAVNGLDSLWISPLSQQKIHFFQGAKMAQQQTLRRAYPSSPTLKTRTPRRSHQLSEEQNRAWNYFLKWKTGLSLDFTEKELKSVFRKLAHKLHPDRPGGSSLHYQELKKNYETLTQVFKAF